MYATPKELLTAFRTQARDQVADYLWSDSEIYQYMTQGESLVAQRLLCLSDMSTSGVAVLDVSAGEPTIELHESVIRVRSAFLIQDGQQRSLDLRTVDGVRGASIFVDTGTPTALLFGGDTGKMRLYPIPQGSATLQLTVFRIPLSPLNATAKFEIPFHYTDAVYEWVRHRAYAKADAETFDKTLSGAGLSSFEYLIDQYATMESRKTGGLKDGVVSYGGI